MKVVIGKVGRSIFFDRNKWKDGAGNNEAPNFFSKIANLNPQNTYYLIGKSDFSRVSDEVRREWFKHDNVKDIWKVFDPKEDDPTTWVTNMLRGINIDYGIIHGGMVSLSIPNKIHCLDRKTKELLPKLRSPLQSLVNYVSPITWFMNERKIPWVTFTSDGRYMPLQARDLIHPESASIGVRQGVAHIERMKSLEEQDQMVEHEIPLIYGAAEMQYLLDDRFNTFRTAPKTQLFGAFFHQYDNKKRIKELKNFVIDNFTDEELAVYGKWKEDGPKFKGTVPFAELQDILPTIKYTFCYPITDGDISGKFPEAIRNGIIPFFHYSYDEKRLLISHWQVPAFLYVRTPEELRNKVEYLEANPKVYEETLKHLVESLDREDLKNGEYFNKKINHTVNILINNV